MNIKEVKKMNYKEMKELKNYTTIVIVRASGRNEVILFKKDCLKEANENREAHYLLGIEQVKLNAIRLAQKEDVDLYILSKRKIIDQLEQNLLAGL